VTDAVRATGGGKVGRAADLDAVLSIETGLGAREAARTAWSGALSEIERAGIERERSCTSPCSRRTIPSHRPRRSATMCEGAYPAPTRAPDAWTGAEADTNIDVYEGSYGPSPDFQRGTIPFLAYGDGGELSFGSDGVPIVEREFELRFALAVPKAAACPEPAERLSDRALRARHRR
jgi:hypothetical protein